MPMPPERIQALVADIEKLTADQFDWVEQLVKAFGVPVSARRGESSVFPDDRSLGLFALYLVTHHVLSSEPFKKEKFEYALERMLAAIGRTVTRPTSRTNPGLDLTVDGRDGR